MDISVCSGAARIISDGFATTFLGQDLVFAIDEAEAGFRMQVVLHFTHDDQLDDVALSVEHTDGNLLLTLVNFDSDKGRGSAAPVMLCQVGDQVVFLHFKVFRFGRTDEHSVQYTFFAVPGSEVDIHYDTETPDE